MTSLQAVFLTAILCVLLAGWPGPLPAQAAPADNPQEVVKLLKEHNRELSRDLRRIQREIAALRADLGGPGIKDVFAGIGYIFGLFGVAAFVAARRRE
jgi:nickel transport protein